MLLGKFLKAAGILFASFSAGAPIAVAALVAEAARLLTRLVHPEEVFAQIDWSLLVMFSGLLILLADLEKTSLDEQLFGFAAQFHLEKIPVLSLVSVLQSNAVSNVLRSCS